MKQIIALVAVSCFNAVEPLVNTCKPDNAGCADFCACANELLPKVWVTELKDMWTAYETCATGNKFDKHLDILDSPEYQSFTKCMIPDCPCKADVLRMMGLAPAARRKRALERKRRKRQTAEDGDEDTPYDDYDICVAKEISNLLLSTKTSIDDFKVFEDKLETAECDLLPTCYIGKCGKTKELATSEVAACIGGNDFPFDADYYLDGC